MTLLHLARVYHEDERFNPHDPAEWPDPCKADTLAESFIERFALTHTDAEALVLMVACEAKALADSLLAEKFRALLCVVFNARPNDPNLAALAFAANLDGLTEFETMQQAADATGMTRANMSHKAGVLRRALGLRNGTHQKSDAQREAQAEAQRKAHELRKNMTKSKGGARQ